MQSRNFEVSSRNKVRIPEACGSETHRAALSCLRIGKAAHHGSGLRRKPHDKSKGAFTDGPLEVVDVLVETPGFNRHVIGQLFHPSSKPELLHR